MFQNDIYFLNETSPFIIKPYQELRFDLRLKPVPKKLGCVQGWVRPLVKTCIKAFDLHLNPIAHTYTEHDGRYELDLTASDYYVAAIAPGYNLSPLVRVRIVPNTCQTLNFWLTRIKEQVNPFYES